MVGREEKSKSPKQTNENQHSHNNKRVSPPRIIPFSFRAYILNDWIKTAKTNITISIIKKCFPIIPV